MTWVEAVGLAGAALNVWGNLMLARLQLAGWVVRLLTNVVWVVYALFTDGGWPVMANHLAFFVINIVGWVSWSKARALGTLRSA